MAYRNASGQITIDEAAANNDIQKMRRAIVQLEESKRSISILKGTASGMKGKTGSAIVEQCQRLENQVTDLTQQLNNSIYLIQKTVQKYKEEDHQVAQQIRKGGGF